MRVFAVGVKNLAEGINVGRELAFLRCGRDVLYGDMAHLALSYGGDERWVGGVMGEIQKGVAGGRRRRFSRSRGVRR